MAEPRPRQKVQHIPGVILQDGSIAEMVYCPEEGTTAFLVGGKDRWSRETQIVLSDDEVLVPYSPQNNLLTHEVLLLPSDAREYGSEQELVLAIRSFIHRFVDVSPEFEEIAVQYVLFTWLFDDFNEVPYLRVQGDFGSGKSRFLLTVGSLCYRSIFASGASTVSPVFRILDSFRGTLVIDEGDFRVSDEKAEIVKIFNNGHARGFPVLRSEQAPTKEFNPRAFIVFGPKVIATRGLFDDRALESRCISTTLGERRLRPDIPLNLTDEFRREARELRNQLLAFRFRTKGTRRGVRESGERGLEPRVAQIFAPLLATVADEEVRGRLREVCRRMSGELRDYRGGSLEGQVLEVVAALRGQGGRIVVKDIAEEFIRRFGEEFGWQATPRWIGNVLRKRLLLKTVKTQGNFVVPASEFPAIDALCERYGVSVTEGRHGDVGDVPREGQGEAHP